MRVPDFPNIRGASWPYVLGWGGTQVVLGEQMEMTAWAYGGAGFIGSNDLFQVKCPLGQVMAVRCRKGQLLALLRGRGRWYPVEEVTIERPRHCPTGACDLGDES